MLEISAFLFNTSMDSHESRTTFSCCNITVYLTSVVIELNLVYE